MKKSLSNIFLLFVIALMPCLPHDFRLRIAIMYMCFGFILILNGKELLSWD